MGELTEALAPVRPRPLPLRVLRILARRAIRGWILLLQALWQRRFSTALVAVLAGLLLLSLSSQISPAASPRAFPLPVPAVESYVEAQRNFDAAGMWEAMSEELRSNFGAVQELQRRINQTRQQGNRVVDSKYVAGHVLDDGRQVYLYVVSIEQGGRYRQVPYMFTVNQAGRILRID